MFHMIGQWGQKNCLPRCAETMDNRVNPESCHKTPIATPAQRPLQHTSSNGVFPVSAFKPPPSVQSLTVTLACKWERSATSERSSPKLPAGARPARRSGLYLPVRRARQLLGKWTDVPVRRRYQ